MISFENVSKFILTDVSFHIPRGEVVGLIGASGSGKTTLIKLAAGLLKPEKGRVSLFGKNPVSNRGKYASRLGVYLTGVPVLEENDTAYLGISMLGKMYDISENEFKIRYDKLANRFGFKDYHDVRIKELSIGQRRRVELAAVFILEPEVYLLDEAEIGLDEDGKQTLEALILERKESGAAFLVTSHNISSVSQLSTRLMILSAGKQVFYGSEEVLRHSFLPINRMTLKYEGDIPVVDDLPLLRYSMVGNDFVCEYDERFVTTSEILAVIMKHSKITDIKINKPDLEQIILQEERYEFYRGKKYQ